MYTTERLRLRALIPSDHEDILALYNDASVAAWMLDINSYVTPVQTDAFQEHYINSFKKMPMFCTIEKLDDGAFVGYTAIWGFETKNRDGSFGITIAPAHQDKGYGTEVTRFMVDAAFDILRLHRLSLSVLSGNGPAISVYKKVGFVEEGRIRKNIWVKGGWQDEVKMGILDDDWWKSKTED